MSSCAQQQQQQQPIPMWQLEDPGSTAYCICVYRPRCGYTLDHLLPRIHKALLHASTSSGALLINFAILRGLTNGSWAAVFATLGEPAREASCKDSESELFGCLQRDLQGVADAVSCRTYEVLCGECKGPGPVQPRRGDVGMSAEPKLCMGDAVHLRWLQMPEDEDDEDEDEEQQARIDLLPYSCVATLKAYLHRIEGLRSCTFYTSTGSSYNIARDAWRRRGGERGRRMVGLGVWESAKAACAFLSSPQGSPAEPFWRSLGATSRCGVCEVVYVRG